jgi:hypothetical protein
LADGLTDIWLAESADVWLADVWLPDVWYLIGWCQSSWGVPSEVLFCKYRTGYHKQ